jgi:hypothetical protein
VSAAARPRPLEDAWLCSGSARYRLLAFEAAPLLEAIRGVAVDGATSATAASPLASPRAISAGLSDYLQSGRPISAAAAAEQLAGLAAAPPSTWAGDEAAAAGFAAALPRLYACMNRAVVAAHGTPSGAELGAFLAATLGNRACVWAGGASGFVPAACVALEDDAQLDARPYLFSAQRLGDAARLNECVPLLRALGVRPRFGASDYVSVLRRVASEAAAEAGAGGAEPPLPPSRLELALAVVQRLSDFAAAPDADAPASTTHSACSAESADRPPCESDEARSCSSVRASASPLSAPPPP